MSWHLESLPEETVAAFNYFAENEKWLKDSGWYLAGGTGLALQTGIRKSFDLDFFIEKESFNEKEIVTKMKDTDGWETDLLEKNTVYGRYGKVKVSFIANPLFKPKEKLITYKNIIILQPIDIAVMKVLAISQRGKKRDFFDLYWCSNNLASLENILKRFKKQYSSVGNSYNHILKSLIYFKDAEEDPDPEINFDADWEKVKSFFEREVEKIFGELINR